VGGDVEGGVEEEGAADLFYWQSFDWVAQSTLKHINVSLSVAGKDVIIVGYYVLCALL